MDFLRSLPFRKVARALARLGFEPVRQRGSHVLFRHGDGRRTVVPRHPGKEIGVGLPRAIIEEAGLTPDEFERAL